MIKAIQSSFRRFDAFSDIQNCECKKDKLIFHEKTCFIWLSSYFSHEVAFSGIRKGYKTNCFYTKTLLSIYNKKVFFISFIEHELQIRRTKSR